MEFVPWYSERTFSFSSFFFLVSSSICTVDLTFMRERERERHLSQIGCRVAGSLEGLGAHRGARVHRVLGDSGGPWWVQCVRLSEQGVNIAAVSPLPLAGG